MRPSYKRFSMDAKGEREGMSEQIWFDSGLWLVLLIPFLGLVAAGLSTRTNPYIKNGKVLRHDVPARISHWCHALGTTFLLVSGIVLGLQFTPSFVGDNQDTAFWMNVHFIFVLLFLFGTFYWLGNTIISRYRLKEHLPTKHLVPYTIQHYGYLLGMKKKFKVPPEKKYFESERAAFIMAVVAAVGVGVSGLIKALAHGFNFSEGFMNVVTWTHDISCVVMLVFFVAHVFMAAIAPFAWKTLPSMFTGFITLDHAKKDHAGWIEELQEQDGTKDRDSTDSAQGDMPPAQAQVARTATK